jgi:hypothetical protein
MASGDNFKVWFPEMVIILKSTWHSTLSWEEIAELCHSMSERRNVIRAQKGIKNPLMHCNDCGEKHELLSTPITIRSLLFALKKENIVDELEFERLDTDWKKYQRKHKLDGSGVSKK